MAQSTPFHQDSPITCSHPPARARVLFDGHILADSAHTLLLQEEGHPPRLYFPREDVEMAALTKNDHLYHCPHKGVASYFTLNRDKKIVENIAWSYERPLANMSEIAGLLSFDLDLVDLQTDIPGAEISKEAAAMGDYIRHTDSGSGRAQEAPWAPNVGRYDEAEDDEEEGRV